MARRALVLALLVGASAAAEPFHVDLRARVGALAGADQLGSSPYSGDYEAENSLTWGPEMVFRQGWGAGLGYAVSLAFFASDQRGSREGVDVTYASAGVELGVGLTWRFGRYWHLEPMVDASLGRGRTIIEPDGVPEIEGDSNDLRGVGARLGLFWTHPQGLQIGLRGGWSSFKGHSTITGDQVEVSGAGPNAVFLLGYSL